MGSPNLQPKEPVAILAGTTASGKTQLALDCAAGCSTPIEMINADSIAIYRGLDIGSAKPSAEEQKQIRHHLIDIKNPDEPLTAGDFLREVEKAILDIESRGARPLVVGGTAFYLKGLLYGLWDSGAPDEDFRKSLKEVPNQKLWQQLLKADGPSAEKIFPNDRYRLIRALEVIYQTGKTPTEHQANMPPQPHPKFRLWVLDRDREELEKRIILRTQRMLEAGLLDEVAHLERDFPDARCLNAVGYAQVRKIQRGDLPRGRKLQPGNQGFIDEIVIATRQLVKHQRTWFRGEQSAQRFILDQDRKRFEEEFRSFYNCRTKESSS